jgi:hypothetical protein
MLPQTDYLVQRRRASKKHGRWRGPRPFQIHIVVTVSGTLPITARNRENRLRFPIPSRVAHSIQKQIAALTNHKEYDFKQSSA